MSEVEIEEKAIQSTPTSVTCISCGASNVGDNVGNVYFSMAQLHKDGCNYNLSKGFKYQTQQGDYIISGELNNKGGII